VFDPLRLFASLHGVVHQPCRHRPALA
jgi:hypothetical protein